MMAIVSAALGIAFIVGWRTNAGYVFGLLTGQGPTALAAASPAVTPSSDETSRAP